MVNRGHEARGRRWGGRAFIRLAVLATVAALFTAVIAQLWQATTTDLKVVDSERAGVAYLRPLTHLVGELTRAQSTAVAGGRVDPTPVNTAIATVDTADGTHGATLGARQRWTDLKARITALIGREVSGDQAYLAYADVTTLAMDLARKVGDTSELILNPELDSYYLMDTVLLRVPDVLVFSGRATDLAVVNAQRPTDAGRTRVAVARFQVAEASDAIGTGLRKAMDATSSATLGPNVTGQLDAFRSAVDAFVPPATLLQSLDNATVDTLAGAAGRIRQQTLPLADATLTELDVLLRERHDALATQRAWAVINTVIGVLLAILLLWLLLPAAPAPATGDADGEDTVPLAGAVPPEGVDTTPVNARDLIAVEELLHVGRAVRGRKRERVDDNAG
jgi:hypothetical protein